MTARYSQFAFQESYKTAPRRYVGFQIINSATKQIPTILIKPVGSRESKRTYALPEVRLLEDKLELANPESTQVVSKIGAPLWFPQTQSGELIGVSCCQAFLGNASSTDHPERRSNPWVWVNQDSVKDYLIAPVNDKTPNTDDRRMEVMIYDGLSIQERPFYEGPITDQIWPALPVHPNYGMDKFVLVDSGNYFAGIAWNKSPDERRSSIALYYRLTPFERCGRFRGSLESLAQR